MGKSSGRNTKKGLAHVRETEYGLQQLGKYIKRLGLTKKAAKEAFIRALLLSRLL